MKSVKKHTNHGDHDGGTKNMSVQWNPNLIVHFVHLEEKENGI